jgi:hypothetical protein
MSDFGIEGAFDFEYICGGGILSVLSFSSHNEKNTFNDGVYGAGRIICNVTTQG